MTGEGMTSNRSAGRAGARAPLDRWGGRRGV